MPQPPFNSPIQTEPTIKGVVSIVNVWQNWLQLAQIYLANLTGSGPTSARPTSNLWVGQPFFDTTLVKQVIWNGSEWVTNGNAGAVTAVTGTTPISSTGGTTPDISMAQSSVSSNGWLSSADWSTFNNKSPSQIKPSVDGSIFENSTARLIGDMFGDFLSVLDFNADPSGIVDSTAAFQYAINTGKHIYVPTGNYVISSQIVITTPGQMISGDGRNRSVLIAQPGFTGNGVIAASNFEEGPQIRDLKITCVQPDTNVLSSLNSYPPALYLVNVPRFTVKDCKITLFQNGINMTGNSGGAFIDLLEMSCFTLGIQIDGALDSVRINNLHYWPFDMTANQEQIFNSTECVGLLSGRCDDLMISNSLFINGGWHLEFQTTATGTTFGQIVNCDFDTWGSVLISGQHSLIMSNCIWTFASVLDPYQHLIANSQGKLQVSNSKIGDYMSSGAFGGSGDITVDSGSFTLFDNCIFEQGADSSSNRLIYCNAILNISNCIFTNAPLAYPNGIVYADTSGVLSFTNNTISGGSGNGVQVASDFHHIITSNNFSGWSLTVPANYSTIVVSNNTNVSGGAGQIVGQSFIAKSNSIGVNYTNTLPIPIFVTILLNNSGGYPNNVAAYIGGTSTPGTGTAVSIAGFPQVAVGQLQFFVPSGSTYRVDEVNPYCSIIDWIEFPYH